MVTANKLYRPEMIFFRIKKKKNEIGKNQSDDSVKQDINLVWPNCKILVKSKIMP